MSGGWYPRLNVVGIDYEVEAKKCGYCPCVGVEGGKCIVGSECDVAEPVRCELVTVADDLLSDFA